MTSLTIWLAGMASVAATPPPSVPDTAPDEMAQLVIRERIVIRVPARVDPRRAAQTRWATRKGPRCVDMDRLGAAAIIEPDSVDLLLKGGARVRAEFADSCPDLEFYSSFYFRPGADRRICADRDSIHSRSGGECSIERFRIVEPAGALRRKRRFRLNPFAPRR